MYRTKAVLTSRGNPILSPLTPLLAEIPSQRANPLYGMSNPKMIPRTRVPREPVRVIPALARLWPYQTPRKPGPMYRHYWEFE